MAKEQSGIKRFLRKLKVPILAGDTTAKFLFLLLSVFLWFLIKLSKEGYVTEFNFPVKYVNIPEDRKLSSKPVSEIRVKVRSHGFDLLKHRLRSFRAIEIDVASNVKGDGESYFWETNSGENLMNVEFDDNTEILSIRPDTVFFEFDEIRNKKVKVYLKARKKYSNFKTFNAPPEIIPDSIIVSGAERDVQGLDSIFTKTFDLTAEADSVTRKIPLDLPKNSKLEFSTQEVTVKLRYTSLTEGSFNIPVRVINLPEGYEMNVFPEKVKLKFQVPVEDYERVTPGEFEAYVDFNDVEADKGTQFLKVRLQAVPAFLRKVTVDPRQLEYILIEK